MEVEEESVKEISPESQILSVDGSRSRSFQTWKHDFMTVTSDVDEIHLKMDRWSSDQNLKNWQGKVPSIDQYCEQSGVTAKELLVINLSDSSGPW